MPQNPKTIGILLILLFLIQPVSADNQAPPVDFPRLIKAAEFANAAYLSAEDIRQNHLSSDYRLTRYHTLAETQVAYFIATNDQTRKQVIAVRGTSNVENAIVDIALKLVADEHTGLRLHAGFAAAARQVYQDIKPILKEDYTIETTGHSLGGAVALILAKLLDTDHYRVGRITTFGQPKVTNVAGAKSFQHLEIIRVVTPLDVVPLVPPLDPLDIRNLDIYWHSGREVLLLEDNGYSILEGVDSMLRATRFTQIRPSENNLHQHRMSLYLELLNNKKLDSKQVPHKNSFNLFNLFGN